MIALTVDDEKLMLGALSAAVKVSPDIDSVVEYTSCSAALEWAREHTADIAFLDISMRGMGGLALGGGNLCPVLGQKALEILLLSPVSNVCPHGS